MIGLQIMWSLLKAVNYGTKAQCKWWLQMPLSCLTTTTKSEPESHPSLFYCHGANIPRSTSNCSSLYDLSRTYNTAAQHQLILLISYTRLSWVLPKKPSVCCRTWTPTALFFLWSVSHKCRTCRSGLFVHSLPIMVRGQMSSLTPWSCMHFSEWKF